MLSLKKSVLSYCTALACSLSLYAADTSEVSTTKTSPKKTFVTGAYSNTEFRVYQKRKLEDSETPKGSMQGRYTIGSNFFDGVLMFLQLSQQSWRKVIQLLKMQGQVLTLLSKFLNDYYSLSGIANVTFPETIETIQLLLQVALMSLATSI